ncbi:MFS transporter [Pararhodobacter zhoushanensis]|uniref:MFS transporter n=1 Tax=Pararhodobacter zhoushanensis TaxID=2479545 RepID=A0ABT3H0Z1_9RHOB|nr:MFS transporter [Pararhodobacter zhoushanensis]MCW1933509.1 MFS transporter [Pararhodobacter zhoushanensis]
MTSRDKTAWGAVAIITLAGAMASAQVGKLPPALPLMRSDMGFGLIAGGFVLSLFNVLGMTIAVLLGGLAEQAGRQRLVALGFGCIVAGGILGALSPNLVWLMVSRLVEGVGFVAVTVSLPYAMVSAAAPRDQGMVLGIWSIYHPFGMALTMLASPVLLHLFGWRGVWWLIAALCPFVAWAALRQMKRLDLPAPNRAPFLPLALEALRTRGFQLIALVFFAYAFQWVTLMAWLPTFLTESFNADLGFAALMTALVVLINVPGCLFGGALIRRGWKPGPMILIATGVMAVSTLGIFLPGPSVGLRVALCLAFSFAGGLIPPALFTCVPRYTPSLRHISAGNGMLMQGSSMGQFIGAPLVAAAVSFGGGNWVFALGPMMGFCALTAVGGILLGRLRPPSDVPG